MIDPGNIRDGVRKRLSYANVMATLAVFLALGGTTLAVTLPRKSVGPKQLKKDAVREKKIQAGAVSAEKLAGGAVTADKLAAGAVTDQGLAGGAVSTGKLANAAVTQAKISPAALPLLADLRPGQTLRGSFNAGGHATVATDNTRQGISYLFPLAEAAPSTEIALNGATTANCPNRNPPQAAMGRLCVYVNGVSNIDGSTVAVENNGRFGFGIRADATAAGDYGASGVWAVTGPTLGMTP